MSKRVLFRHGIGAFDPETRPLAWQIYNQPEHVMPVRRVQP
jgi:hypothetical protein